MHPGIGLIRILKNIINDENESVGNDSLFNQTPDDEQNPIGSLVIIESYFFFRIGAEGFRLAQEVQPPTGEKNKQRERI